MTSLVLSLNKFSYFGPMIVVVFKYLTRFGIRGLTLYPFVIVADSFAADDVVLINHERIHLRQQLELLVIPFYIWYLLAFAYGRIKFGNWYDSYRNICFEKEAYENENNLEYLETRLFWGFWGF